MPSFTRMINSIIDPKIPLDPMEAVDTETNQGEGSVQSHKAVGDLFPYIIINGYQFLDKHLMSFDIDMTGFVPTCTLSVVMLDGVFLSKSYPKDGDLINVFIRSKVPEFRPIRADFEITDVNMSPSLDETGETAFITFEGVLRIPGLWGEVSRAFSNMTSWDALLEVASTLDMGYASNQLDTDDRMNWLCPYDTYMKFVQDVTDASYATEDSFMTSYIDWYYYLNFVNVDTQFSEESELDEAAVQSLLYQDNGNNAQPTPTTNTKLFLCNYNKLKGSQLFISRYNLDNAASRVSMDVGYRRHVQFYDINSKTLETHFHEPINTRGTEDKVILKGRANESFWERRQKYKWFGPQWSLPKHNVHVNYFYGQSQNYQNNKELEKMNLVVHLSKANFNIYRYMRLPIIILNEGNQQRRAYTKGQDERDNGNPTTPEITWDKFLTGFYVVKGMRYSWSRGGGWNQSLHLAKREWELNI